MKLIVGLGNPGSGSMNQRHNIGFRIVDRIVHHYDFGAWKRRFHSRLYQGMIDTNTVYALLPQTYMNRSGEAVKAAVHFWKIEATDLIVFHDDIDLLPGQCKIKKGGGSAGHKGLRSLDAHVGLDYWRIRLGIGHPGDKTQVASYVLHDFSSSDTLWLNLVIDKCVTALPLLIADRPDLFRNALSNRPHTQPTDRTSVTQRPDPRERRQNNDITFTKDRAKQKVCRAFFRIFLSFQRLRRFFALTSSDAR